MLSIFLYSILLNFESETIEKMLDKITNSKNSNESHGDEIKEPFLLPAAGINSGTANIMEIITVKRPVINFSKYPGTTHKSAAAHVICLIYFLPFKVKIRLFNIFIIRI
jgi:hypothetical protein